MVGILVHGDNHFIVRGPEPDAETARDMVRRWSLIQIGAPPADHSRISTREFRENLQWAVVVHGEVVPAEPEHSPAVIQLLKEMAARGVSIRICGH
jgi:hypothetical protein